MGLNVARIRGDFPCLCQDGAGRAPVYLDNACMTLKPMQVLDAMSEYYTKHPSCHKRAMHRFGVMTTKKYARARCVVKEYLNAPKDSEVIFTRNTTESINLVANSLDLAEGSIVLISDAEHNSNLLPWVFLCQRSGLLLRTFPVRPDGPFEGLQEYRQWLETGKVKLVSTFHTSNVTGITLPIREMVSLAHHHGAMFFLDAAQGLPHQPIDVRALDADFVAFSFHKAFGPTGMGALYGRTRRLEELRPFLVGGDTIEDADYGSCTLSTIPERFEAGLQNYAGVIGSAAALEYLANVGIAKVERHERELNEFITGELTKLPKVRILGPPDAASRSSIVSFIVEGLDSGELSILLDKSANVMTRSGVHCCHAWFHKYDLLPSLRVSLSIYNTLDEAELLVRTLHSIIKHF